VGTTFDRVMREQGRKATWLSEQTGYSSALITRVRKGERTATPEFRAKVAAALEMDESELFPDPAAEAA
jgi:transcriptional regulator with XRE-family HTH domain